MSNFLKSIGFLFFFLGFPGCSQSDPAANERAAREFLEQNGARPGVQHTASGLQYEILVQGEGAMPSARDTVTVNYAGRFLSGEEFDSGEGISFPLKGVIPGWTEGLQLMKTGSKYRFYIPPELAYGAHGAGRLIGPNMALIFDVELKSIR